MKKINKLFFIFLPLFFGIVVYIFQNYFHSYIRFYFPDFCWAFSLIFSQYVVKAFYGNLVVIFFVSSILSLVYEIGQKLNYFKGTFDIFDILVYHLAFILAILLARFFEK